MKRFFTSLLFMYLAVSLSGQQESALLRLGGFVKNIQAFNHLYPQEKVYLHFDNTGYFLGETIWFKAYVTLAANHVATPLSRVLYVELLNTEGHVMRTERLCIENGQASGGIALTKIGMKSGFYEVRAYTRIMLNWDKDYLFSRVFPIFDTPAKEGDYQQKHIRLRPHSQKLPPKRDNTPSLKKLNATFYPEGGAFVQGVTSQAAFQLMNKEGCAITATGAICTPKGDTLTTFSTVHEGMGSFIYTPTETPCVARILCEGEKKPVEFALPQALAAGCVIQANTLHPEMLQVSLRCTKDWPPSKPLGVTVLCRGEVNFFKILDFTSTGQECLLRIPKSELPVGVNQLTLFTDQGEVLAERLVFIHGTPNSLRISVAQEKEQYIPFELIRMQVNVRDTSDAPIATCVSLAVRDAGTDIPSAYNESAGSNLLLSSDLRGFIQDPGYYFEGSDRTRLLALDLLMLTQGYRRYSWTQMAGQEEFAPSHKIEKGIVINGHVKSIVRKRTEEGINVRMTLFCDSAYHDAKCPTDPAGNFNYLADDFYGKWGLQMETKKKNKRKEYWITLDRLFSPLGRSYSYYDTYIQEMQRDKSKTRFVIHQDPTDAIDLDSLMLAEIAKGIKPLQDVVVTAKREWETRMARAANIVYDVAEEEDKLEDNAGGYNENIFEFLKRINPYFDYDYVYTSKGNIVMDYCNSPRLVGRYKNRGVGFMIDGNEESNIQCVSLITSLDVESIAIVEDGIAARALSPRMASSSKNIALICLKLNNRRPKGREPIGVRMTSIQGFSLPRDFYSPNYKDNRLPDEKDYRRTLYWNPNVTTNSYGRAAVSFYNNSSCQEMSISAETVTQDGTLGLYKPE